MKHVLLTLLCAITMVCSAHAQTDDVSSSDTPGKPLYLITVTRGGKPLGSIKVALFPDIAPKHVANFDSLVAIKFYDSTAFHRVVPGFVIQGGDPNSKNLPKETWGYGDPSQTTVEAEFTRLSHVRGALSAARSNDPNSATSQFFICVAAATNLDGNYSVYGRVVEGMNIADSIVKSPRDANDGPKEKVEMMITKVGVDTTSVPAVPLDSPADSAGGVLRSTKLKWKTLDSVLLYQFQLSETYDFAEPLDTLIPGTSFGIAMLPADGKRYFWRVRATNGGVRGPFSPIWTFKMTSPNGVDIKASAGDVEVSGPSALDGRVAVRFSLPQQSVVTLSLSDAAGREALAAVTETKRGGENTMSLDASSLRSGVYFCRVQMGDRVVIRKVMVTR